MKILLVEDEKSLSRALVKILEHANYSVDPVYDGEEALDYLADGSYDAVVLDIMIPKKDGLTVLRETRAKGNNVPVLLLTAKSEIEDRVSGLDAGANDYLTKPFAPPELLARIRAMLRIKMQAEGADASGTDIILGNLRLSRTTYELSSPNGSFRLAGKEYQMMEMLMTNPNALISTERFFEKIWGYDSDAEINVVWVYISYLRKKLDSLNADVAIKASRGAGYSLVEKQ
ncbi:MAG: response regulator transcription factor [Lachnospiraceae bacterium]|nr:response regulator transcription factor [Lachnospiraceae bacterium]